MFRRVIEKVDIGCPFEKFDPPQVATAMPTAHLNEINGARYIAHNLVHEAWATGVDGKAEKANGGRNERPQPAHNRDR
jgi:hypothetical protein